MASMPLLPEAAILGGFTLVIVYFISEITDCTQQLKAGPPASPFPGPRPVWLPSAMPLIKISSRDTIPAPALKKKSLVQSE